MPDNELKWNDETGHHDFGEIDWDEFNDVLAGNGLVMRKDWPCETKLTMMELG